MFKSFIKQKWQRHSGSCFSHNRICFTLLHIIINGIALGLGLLVRSPWALGNSGEHVSVKNKPWNPCFNCAILGVLQTKFTMVRKCGEIFGCQSKMVVLPLTVTGFRALATRDMQSIRIRCEMIQNTLANYCNVTAVKHIYRELNCIEEPALWLMLVCCVATFCPFHLFLVCFPVCISSTLLTCFKMCAVWPRSH